MVVLKLREKEDGKEEEHYEKVREIGGREGKLLDRCKKVSK